MQGLAVMLAQRFVVSCLIGATVDAVDTYYHAHGVVFEFYDSKNTTDPTTLKRKGLTSGGVRDYHWTAALVFRMIGEL